MNLCFCGWIGLKTAIVIQLLIVFFIILQMFSIWPVASCSCKRVFLKLNIVKRKLRSTMGKNCVESLILLFTKQEWSNPSYHLTFILSFLFPLISFLSSSLLFELNIHQRIFLVKIINFLSWDLMHTHTPLVRVQWAS